MAPVGTAGRLDRPVDEAVDHVLGRVGSDITLVEYGSYACPHCRAANEQLTETRDEFGDRLCYVFRHRPVPGDDLARSAAELIERAPDPEHFWKAHVALMTRSDTLTEDDLRVVAEDLGLRPRDPDTAAAEARRAKGRVDTDVASARASGVAVTPTFFINGRRYEGLWEKSAFTDALIGSLGHRVRAAALDFARWAPSAGVLLLLAAVLAVIITNSAWGPGFLAFWETYLGVTVGDRGQARRVLVAAGHRGGRPGWHRLHDVAVHRRGGVPGAPRFRARQDRRLRRVDPRRGGRRGRALGRGSR